MCATFARFKGLFSLHKLLIAFVVLAVSGVANMAAAQTDRDSLLGAESETGNLLVVDPNDGTGEVIGNTGVVPLTALAKSPISGVVYGGGPLTPLYTYQTIIELDPDGEEPPPDGIDTIIIDWISPNDSGNVSASDLTYLSIAFLDGASNLYYDVSIINGVVQPIGGEPRTIADVFWDFNLDTNLLSQLSNAPDSVMEAVTGVHYQIADGVAIPIDGEINIWKYDDGDNTAFGFGTIDPEGGQNTNELRVEAPVALWEINQQTGEATVVDILVVGGCDGPCEFIEVLSINGADFDADGQLWAAITVEEEEDCEGPCFFQYEALTRIDTEDASAEIIGEGLEADDIDGISFDHDGDEPVLWGVSSSEHKLYQIDLDEGVVGSSATIDFYPDSAPGDGFKSLQFTCDDMLYAGVGEEDGDGGDLYLIQLFDGEGFYAEAQPVGVSSATDDSSLGGLALHTTCGTDGAEGIPTPEGEVVTVVSTEVFEQVAGKVVVAGTTNAYFCVLPDLRYVGDTFTARNLYLSEYLGSGNEGSCLGPVVPGSSKTWETDIFPHLDLVIMSWYRSYKGEFEGTEGHWLVLGVVSSTAEFDGPVSYVTFPEVLIDYSGTTAGEIPACDNALPWRNLDIAGTVEEFGDFPNFERNRMIVETAQCNRSKSMTRRTTHIYPVRYVYPKAGSRAEAMNMSMQFSGISGTLREASACADPTVISLMNTSLRDARMDHRYGRYDDAILALEEIARLAKNAEVVPGGDGSGFSGCDVERNYRGNFMSRGVTAAFTVHDRFKHAASWVKYYVPADLEIPLLDTPPPPIP